MQLSSPDRLIAAFQSIAQSPEAIWTELRAWLLLDLRTERDGVFELGRLIVLQAQKEAEGILGGISRLPLLRVPPVGSVDFEQVARYSSMVRRMSRPLPDEVLEAIEQEGGRLALELLGAQTPGESREIGLAAARTIVSCWRRLVVTWAGAQTLLTQADALPRIDSSYLSHKLSDWALDAAWVVDPQRRQEVVDAVLSGLVFTRLLRRNIVPPLYHPNQVGLPTGQCIRATVAGLNSGPFRTGQGCSWVQTETESGADTASVQYSVEPVADFPLAHPDGYYYFQGVPPGMYSCRLAANLLPGDSVLLTLEYAYGGSRIAAADLRDAIAAALIVGLAISVEMGSGQRPFVRVTASAPVSGPWAWFRFHTFSDSWMSSFFPGLQLAGNYHHAGHLARELNESSERMIFASRLVHLAGGMFAYPGIPDPDSVALVKTSGGCLVDGNEVIPTGGVPNVIAVGDECVLFDQQSQSLHRVLSIGLTSFMVDGVPLISAGDYSIAPYLNLESGTGMVLGLGGRWYRFDLSALETSLEGYRCIRLGDRGHWAPDDGFPMDCLIGQQILEVGSKNTTVDSRIQVFAGQDALATEVGFGVGQVYAMAHEWLADVTAADGFSSRVKTGDAFVVPAKGELLEERYEIEEVRDGVLRLASPIFVNAQPSGTLVNTVREGWEKLVAASLPDFDVARFEFLIQQFVLTGDLEFVNEMELRASDLVDQLSSVESAVGEYADKPNAPATRSILAAMERVYGKFGEQLKQGKLEALGDSVREATVAGSASVASGLIADQYVTQLTAIERLLLGRDD